MKRVKTACLGPDGSFSALAARSFRKDDEIVMCRSFLEAADSLQAGEADFSVFPIENSTQGGIRQNLDILESHADFFAVEELILPIDHRLVTLNGVETDDVRRVYSHEEAMMQCRNHIRALFPDAELVSTSSTAMSLNLLDGHSAGIVGSHVKREGVTVSKENFADEPTNRTHFLLVKKGEDENARSEKIFICVTLAHKSGTLAAFLKIIEDFRLNLTKIESRPIPTTPGEYRFFLEFEGDASRGDIKRAMKVLKEHCIAFRFLGAYCTRSNAR